MFSSKNLLLEILLTDDAARFCIVVHFTGYTCEQNALAIG